MSSEDVEIVLREYERSMADVYGCGNHGCIVNPPKGMGTNAGCRCWMDKMTAQRAMIAAKRLHKRLRELKPL